MLKKVKALGQLIKEASYYLYYGWKHEMLRPYSKSLLDLTRTHVGHLKNALAHTKNTKDEKILKLKAVTSGLHGLMPEDPLYSYSILLCVSQPRPSLFEKGLQSLVDQTAPRLEILIGLEKELSSAVRKILQRFKEAYPGKIRDFYIDSQNAIAARNHLAQEANGRFLLIVDQEDWLRPDLLFRYEQALRLIPNPQQTVLYCYENGLNKKDCFIPQTDNPKPLSLAFPFFFEFFSHRGLLIPTDLWKRCQGLREKYLGAEYEDLLLRLSLAGASFHCIPFYLYAKREPIAPEYQSQEALCQALEEYGQTKQLDWSWSKGYTAHTVRGIPQIKQKHAIQVIIPFKDQKALTLKCIQSLLKQKDVELKITAVNNRSQDETIADEIQRLGGEVLTVNEPFNYSRLNNLACQNTQMAADCDVLLFLNNDIELDSEALLEMLRWIDQPSIGLVGCRLHYPDRRLQHGGVSLEHRSNEMIWEHTEKGRTLQEMNLSKKLGIFPAVTAACAMIKRQTFLEIGGFDEIWYPIGYSDTSLAVKLHHQGLCCFYTPYAHGIHHESVSRKESLEDVEKSQWLHQLWLDRYKSKSLTRS